MWLGKNITRQKKGKKPAPLNTQKSWTLKRRESRIPAIENNRKNRNKKIEKTRKNIGIKKNRAAHEWTSGACGGVGGQTGTRCLGPARVNIAQETTHRVVSSIHGFMRQHIWKPA